MTANQLTSAQVSAATGNIPDFTSTNVNISNLTGTTANFSNSLTVGGPLTVSGNLILPYPTVGSFGSSARLQVGANADFGGSTYALGVACPTTGAPYPFGVLIAGTGALSVSKFYQVYTKNSTLDDGNGNLTAGGTIAATGFNTSIIAGSTGSTNAAFALQGQNSTWQIYNRGTTGASPNANNILGFYNNQANTTALTISQTNVVATKNNTLDDGSGNMTATGNMSTQAVFRAMSGTAFVGQYAAVYNNGQYFSDAVVGDTIMRGELNNSLKFGFQGSGGGQVSSLVLGYPYTVKTKNNTLDDGNGCMTLGSTGTFSTSGNVSSAAGIFHGSSNTTLPSLTSNYNLVAGIGGGSGNIQGVIQTNTAGSTGTFPLSFQASVVQTVSTTGSVRNILDDGSGNMTVAGTLKTAFLSNGTTSYVIPSNTTDPRALRLSAEPNYLVSSTITNGFTLGAGSPGYLIFGGTPPTQGTLSSGITVSNANSSITVAAPGLYKVECQLVGTIAASSTAVLAFNSTVGTNSIGGGTGTIVNFSSSTTAMSLTLTCWVNTTTASSQFNFSTTNFSSLTNGSISIVQIMNQ